MLIATPYRDFGATDRTPPRIISEIRKNNNCSGFYFQPSNVRAKITGDLLVKFKNDRTWWPRRVTVRCGQLLLSAGHGHEGPSSVRLPLRHLSLQAGSLPNSLSLCRGQSIVLTLQTATQRVFDEWVKTIAIELIRQTPLDAIKYLDILTIAECWNKRRKTHEEDWKSNEYTTNISNSNSCVKNYQVDSLECKISKPTEKSIEIADNVEERYVEDLLKKCQNSEKYVPVKEKLFLFETLCKLDRRVRSTEDISLKIETTSKRARSLHDLSNLNSHIAVREICKYFENKNGKEEKNIANFRSERLLTSDTQLNNVYKVRRKV